MTDDEKNIRLRMPENYQARKAKPKRVKVKQDTKLTPLRAMERLLWVFEKELKRISMKAIPLPPIRELEKKNALKRPVMAAVTSTISSNFPDPYFSSSSGPTSSMMVIFPEKCAQLW